MVVILFVSDIETWQFCLSFLRHQRYCPPESLNSPSLDVVLSRATFWGEGGLIFKILLKLIHHIKM